MFEIITESAAVALKRDPSLDERVRITIELRIVASSFYALIMAIGNNKRPFFEPFHLIWLWYFFSRHFQNIVKFQIRIEEKKQLWK